MARERRSSTLPSKSIKAVDVLLVGLLTYASSDLSCLPRKLNPGGTSLLSSWRLQLRGSGGFSPRFPFTKRKVLYAAGVSMSMH